MRILIEKKELIDILSLDSFYTAVLYTFYLLLLLFLTPCLVAVQPYIEWMNLNFLKKEKFLDKIEWEYVKTNKVWTQFSTEVCNTLIFVNDTQSSYQDIWLLFYQISICLYNIYNFYQFIR